MCIGAIPNFLVYYTNSPLLTIPVMKSQETLLTGESFIERVGV